MEFDTGDLVKTKYVNTAGNLFEVTKCIPNFRGKNVYGYALTVADTNSIFYGERWCSVTGKNLILVRKKSPATM